MKLIDLLNLLNTIAREGRTGKIEVLHISPWDFDELEEEAKMAANKCVGPEYKIVDCHLKYIAGIKIVPDMSITIGEAMPE